MTSDEADARRLPAQRAFVVQLSADADVTSGRVTGRVEHIVSARAAHFQALPELLAFMAQTLAEVASAPARRGASHDRSGKEAAPGQRRPGEIS